MTKDKNASDDETEVPGADVAVELERLSRLMRAGEHSEGLNPAQWEALRYLARANRFSNSPGALTLYLGATKGTISQTVKALERKGFITKKVRDGERRSLVIDLTDRGRQALANDPWLRLAAAIERLGGKTRRRLARGVRELLSEEIVRSNAPHFGMCATCRYFREKGRDDDPRGPHFCMLLEQPLSAPDSQKICVEHEAAM